MQKYISVPTARIIKWLLSPLLIGICWFNTAAFAAVSPIPLLVEQCLAYQFPAKNQTSITIGAAQHAAALERQLIGFFNINDRIKYYRQFPLSYSDRELVLQCQLYLADELALFFKSTQFQSTRFKLAESHNPHIQALAMRINRLATNSESPLDKAQLHTAQAAFKQGVTSQQLSLNFANTGCQLDAKLNSVKTNFNGSLASYLIKQPNEQCRKTVWQAYQARASIKNKTSFEVIKNLRQQQAEQDGYQDHSHEILQQQWLSHPQLVVKFLQSQTQAINTNPWSLGQVLSNAKPTVVEPTSSRLWLNNIAKVLEPLAVSITPVNEKVLRVYHQHRLLGDLYLSQGKKTQARVIRHAVVGQQFGQYELVLKDELTNYQQQSAMIDTVASIISQLASGHRYYLQNTLGETQDSDQIDKFWLQMWLKGELLPTPKNNSREAVLQRYATQLQIFRAKVALNSYLSSEDKNRFDLDSAFKQAFSARWDSVDDAPYTFSAIVYQGPLYYQKVWQKAVAKYIYQSTKDCQNQKHIFDYLVVNESANDMVTQLQLLLDETITPDSLIKRTQHAFNHQDQHSRRCTLLRQ